MEGIGTALQAARLSFQDAATVARQLEDEAADLQESASSHGWSALAEAMSSVQESLQEVTQAIDGADEASAEAVTHVSKIAGEASSNEIAGHLTAAVGSLGTAHAAAEQAIALLDTPRSAAQEADARAVAERLDEVEGHLRDGRAVLAAAVERAETAQEQAETWGDASGEGGRRPSRTPPGSPGTADPPNGEGITEPSGAPDPTAEPEGLAETAPRASRDVQVSLGYQDESARILARSGYRVRRLAQSEEGVNPDYEVEGRIFEGYSPNPGTTATAVVTRMRKESKRQATRFVLNLDRGALDASAVRARLEAARPGRLREVLVVKDGTITRVWP